MGNKHICLPFASEAQYREYVDDPGTVSAVSEPRC